MARFRTFAFAFASIALASAAPAAPPAAAPLPPDLAHKAECAALTSAFAEMAAGQARERTPGPRLPPSTGAARIKIIEGRGKRCWKWGACFIKVDDGPNCPRACRNGVLTRGPGDTVVLEYTSAQPMPEGELFVIERNMAVPAPAARQIGARGALVLQAGEYRPTLSDGGRTIRVELPVKAQWAPEKDEARG